MVVRTRFAPSPTGLLHKGHALSALTAEALAHAQGGQFIVRIEDIDRQRCRSDLAQAALDDLAWLGIKWDEPVRFQSNHVNDYHQALSYLKDRGLIYRCFQTRKTAAQDIGRAPHGLGLAHHSRGLPSDDEARRVASGEAYAWRLSIEAARAYLGPKFDTLTFEERGKGAQPAHPQFAGDIILGRKDLGVAYHLAVVVDDALQQVSHVVRGEDLFALTGIQRLLQALLDLPTPIYCHHRLLTGADGKRLAKRDRSETLRAIRDSGISPQALRAELGFV
jgi:glutamyl-Q tRNA(Asp) synthetase